MNSNTIDWYFENLGFSAEALTTAYIGYGAMSGLGHTSPPMVYDNAADPRPLRTGKLTATIADPFIGKDKTLEFSALLATKTDVGGGAISNIACRGSGNFVAVLGREAIYDVTAFDGNGGLYAPDNTTAYVNDANITALAWNRIEIVLDIPETIPTLSHVIGFGTSASAQVTPRCSLMLSATGVLTWLRKQDETGQDLSADLRGQRATIVIDFISLSEAIAYINDQEPIIFDPRDNIPNQTRLWIFAGDDTGTSGVQITCPDMGIAFVKWHTAATIPTNIETGAAAVAYLAGLYNTLVS